MVAKLGKVLRLYRVVNEIQVRAMAKDIGIPSSTLNNLEKQENHIIQDKTMVSIINWLLRP